MFILTAVVVLITLHSTGAGILLQLPLHSMHDGEYQLSRVESSHEMLEIRLWLNRTKDEMLFAPTTIGRLWKEKEDSIRWFKYISNDELHAPTMTGRLPDLKKEIRIVKCTIPLIDDLKAKLSFSYRPSLPIGTLRLGKYRIKLPNVQEIFVRVRLTVNILVAVLLLVFVTLQSFRSSIYIQLCEDTTFLFETYLPTYWQLPTLHSA